MRIVVVGAGIGGIASAIRLRARGHEVTVFDANPYPGGKLSSVEAGGYRFDAGPSLLTLPHLVTDLFAIAGESPLGKFEFFRKDVACHYFYPDGTFFRAFAEPTALAAEVERVFCVPAQRVTNYLKQSELIYECAGRLFTEQPLNSWKTWFSPMAFQTLLRLPRLGLASTLHDDNVKRLGEEKLVQYFDRMATYNGSNPYVAPAILSMIPHLEHNVGTFLPIGGMIAITRSLVELAKGMGVTFELGCRVNQIVLVNGQASGVDTARGRFLGDLVICNADVSTAYRQLLPESFAPKRLLSQERSSSAVIFYLGMRRRYPKLDLHNVFFSGDYEAEFKAIFEHGDICRDPTVYIAVTSKHVPSDAPDGCENWFVMVNAPANQGQDWDALIQRLRLDVIAKLERQLGEPITPFIEVERVLDPRSIEAKTSSYQGALYGASSNSKYAAFLRHPNETKRIAALYFCGGSVHPGGGIPLCLSSAQIVSQQVLLRYGQ